MRGGVRRQHKPNINQSHLAEWEESEAYVPHLVKPAGPACTAVVELCGDF